MDGLGLTRMNSSCCGCSFAAVWLVLAFLMAVVAGRGIDLADRGTTPAAWTDDIDAYLQQQSPDTDARTRPDRGFAGLYV